MKKELNRTILVCGVLVAAIVAASGGGITLTPLATYDTGVFDEGAAETVAYDPVTQRLFVSNGDTKSVDVLDISDPADPQFAFRIDVSDLGKAPTHVEVHSGIVAVSISMKPVTDPGKLALFDTDGNELEVVTVGSLPDSLKFTPDGTKVVVVNEGEPSDDYLVDPEGSISIVDLATLTVKTATFTRFNVQKTALIRRGIRIYGPAANDAGELIPGAATVAQDLEPENLTISEDSRTAWVTLQENNALAIVDLERASVTQLVPLGYKPHFVPQRGLDASDKDGMINIATWPVLGMYQPDGIASYSYGGSTYLVIANEGDAREYIYEVETGNIDPETGEPEVEEVVAFAEEEKAGKLDLTGPFLERWPELQENENLGRLVVTTCPPAGKTVTRDGDELYRLLFSFGGRSFSVLTSSGMQIYDSGDDMEQQIAASPDFSPYFNSTDDANDSFDNRSDNKGPEPEELVLGAIGGRVYAFIALERIGGIIVYDVTCPWRPSFATYANPRDFTVPAEEAGDLSPEGLTFISPEDSPSGTPLLAVANEVSGTTTIYRIDEN